MKHLPKICAIILIVALSMSLLCTMYKLDSAREELDKANAKISVMEVEAAIMSAENLQMKMEQAQAAEVR